jgi:hypothetical protein
MTPEIRERLLEIAQENVEELFEECGGSEGLWVAEGRLPSEPSEFDEEEYEALFSPARIEEIKSGHQPTEAELLALRKARLEKLLDPGADPDLTPGYSLVEVVDHEEDGDEELAVINTGIAVILCTGSSFFGLELDVLNVFDTKEDALAYLNNNGWTPDFER